MITFVVVAVIPAIAVANETVNYSYDAKGRLVKVERSGTVNNGVVTNYTFDKADNRVLKNTSGSPNSGPP
jgi:hypothetical protein